MKSSAPFACIHMCECISMVIVPQNFPFPTDVEAFMPKGGDATRYCGFIPLEYIHAVTNNFDESTMVGEGGFGKVYRGVTDEGVVWAVKRSKVKYVKRGVKMEFEIEVCHPFYPVVRTQARINHSGYVKRAQIRSSNLPCTCGTLSILSFHSHKWRWWR